MTERDLLFLGSMAAFYGHDREFKSDESFVRVIETTRRRLYQVDEYLIKLRKKQEFPSSATIPIEE